MADDIVKRLRNCGTLTYYALDDLCRRAADEITRLRKQVALLEARGRKGVYGD